jgi:hypothetical protein
MNRFFLKQKNNNNTNVENNKKNGIYIKFLRNKESSCICIIQSEKNNKKSSYLKGNRYTVLKWKKTPTTTTLCS